MFSYAVFGGTLSTDLHFPELATGGDSSRRWLIRRSRHPLRAASGVLAGEDEVDGSIRVRLYVSEAGHALQYDDTGTFLISPDGHEITWSPGSDPDPEAARLDILGRVLPLALQMQGRLCLHASAAAIAGSAIGFVAPKFHGKSTIAQALVGSGAKLVTDDVLPVEIGESVRVLPGVQRTRLWPDSARRFAAAEGDDADAGAKVYLDLSPERISSGPTPLAAIYLLNPVRGNQTGDRPARRSALPQLEATMVLMGHCKLGPLMTGDAARTLLDRAVRVATRIPVYRLDVARDLDRLNDVVEQLNEWHVGIPSVRSSAVSPELASS